MIKVIYGSYRIQKKLEREGLFYSRSYIALLMKEMSFKSVLRRKFVTTTNSKHEFPIAGNHLGRSFNGMGLRLNWVSEITYIRVNDNWNFLATIIDLTDRKKIVGWVLSEDMTVQSIVMKAWVNACKTRTIHQGFIFHSEGVCNMPQIK